MNLFAFDDLKQIFESHREKTRKVLIDMRCAALKESNTFIKKYAVENRPLTTTSFPVCNPDRSSSTLLQG